MQKTKAILTQNPSKFKDMVLQLYAEHPETKEYPVAETIGLTAEEFTFFVSFLDKPHEWLACHSRTEGAIRITAPNFPIALVAITEGTDRVKAIGFEMTDE